MQIYAFDGKELIAANQAEKGKAYNCPECGECVHRRSSLHRRVHFYHSTPSSACRLNGKSLTHLHVQNMLEKLLPGALLEHRFPSIDRIADVFWEAEKLIFEVQCSPMSPEEAISRTRDYRSLGLEVVWILHDKRYNKEKPSKLELALHALPHYFTNIDGRGVGVIYDKDQLVDLSKPARYRGMIPPLYFAGDVIDQNLSRGEMILKKKPPFWERYVAHPYRRLLEALLEPTYDA